jgi:PqqD family protein of HPr-rel-A system
LSGFNYSINPAVKLHWRLCGEDFVVFEESSGQTHLLEPVRAFLLNAFQEGQQDVGVIKRKLCEANASCNSEGIEFIFNQIIDEFKAIGLIETSVR